MLLKEAVLDSLSIEELAGVVIRSPSSREMAGRKLLEKQRKGKQNLQKEKQKEDLLMIVKLIPSLAPEAARQALKFNLNSTELEAIDMLVPSLRPQVENYRSQRQLRAKVFSSM